MKHMKGMKGAYIKRLPVLRILKPQIDWILADFS